MRCHGGLLLPHQLSPLQWHVRVTLDGAMPTPPRIQGPLTASPTLAAAQLRYRILTRRAPAVQQPTQASPYFHRKRPSRDVSYFHFDPQAAIRARRSAVPGGDGGGHPAAPAGHAGAGAARQVRLRHSVGAGERVQSFVGQASYGRYCKPAMWEQGLPTRCGWCAVSGLGSECEGL